jgi:hypothetical protein
MILQTDRRLRSEIRDYGCYFMSILWHVVRLTGLALDTDIINALYIMCVNFKWMDNNCKILDPQAIFRHLNVWVRYTDRHEPIERMCAEDEIEVLCWSYQGKTHFVAGDGRGNVTYDPAGESQSVKYGFLASKRIFGRKS